MFKIKKVISICIILVFVLSFTASCTTTEKQSETMKIVAAAFPEYDWTKQIIGDQKTIKPVELSLLADNGVDIHSFQPSAADVAKIIDCDIFIYNGGEADKWVSEVLKNAANKDILVIKLIDAVDLLYNEDHEEHDHGDDDHSEHDHMIDEHIWLSLNNAVKLCDYITDKISSVIVENAEIYRENNKVYTDKIKTLDAQFKEKIDNNKTNTVVFADRFPFRYLFADYNIKYYSAFDGCSAEVGANFDTPIFLAKKVDEFDLQKIVVLEGSKDSIASVVIDNTNGKNQTVLALNSLQSITKEQLKDGKHYFDVMKKNLELLGQALLN